MRRLSSRPERSFEPLEKGLIFCVRFETNTSVFPGLTSTYAESVLDKIEGFLREENTCEKELSDGFSFRI